MELRDAQAIFFEKFAHMYDSGVPIAESLEIAASELGAPLEAVLPDIVDDLYRGSSLADAVARHPSVFSAEIAVILRAGELRGELSPAARSVADGLRGRVVASRAAVPDGALDALIELAEAGSVYLDPDGRIRVRPARPGGAGRDAGAVDHDVGAALAARARLRDGRGAFAWRDRIVRVARIGTADGPAMVLRLSAAPPAECAAAARWREARPSLLVVRGRAGDDLDAPLLGAISGLDRSRQRIVAIDLPLPGLMSVETWRDALALRPDVVACASTAVPTAAEIGGALAAGVRVVVAVRGASPIDRVAHFATAVR